MKIEVISKLFRLTLGRMPRCKVSRLPIVRCIDLMTMTLERTNLSLTRLISPSRFTIHLLSYPSGKSVSVGVCGITNEQTDVRVHERLIVENVSEFL